MRSRRGGGGGRQEAGWPHNFRECYVGIVQRSLDFQFAPHKIISRFPSLSTVKLRCSQYVDSCRRSCWSYFVQIQYRGEEQEGNFGRPGLYFSQPTATDPSKEQSEHSLILCIIHPSALDLLGIVH